MEIERVADHGGLRAEQRGVGADAMDVAAEKRVRSIIFGDQRVAIIEELRGGRAAAGLRSRHLPQPAERIVDERGTVRTRRQPVLEGEGFSDSLLNP